MRNARPDCGPSPPAIATWKQLRVNRSQWNEDMVRTTLVSFGELWEELFPAEQQRITSLLVERVVLFPAKVDVHLLLAGFTSLVTEMKGLTAGLDQAA